MELSRSDFQILNVLKEHQCTNYQESMTLQEIIPELPFSRVVIEIYVNDGENVFTSRFYFPRRDRTVCVEGADRIKGWYLSEMEGN